MGLSSSGNSSGVQESSVRNANNIYNLSVKGAAEDLRRFLLFHVCLMLTTGTLAPSKQFVKPIPSAACARNVLNGWVAEEE